VTNLVKFKRMKNSWITDLRVRFRCLVRPLFCTKQDIEHFFRPLTQPISDDFDKWDIASSPTTYKKILAIIICIRRLFTLVFLAHIEISKISYNFEHNNKHKDRCLYIVSTSHQYEPVDITIDCSAVMTNVFSDSLYLGKRVLRQKYIFRLQYWVHRH